MQSIGACMVLKDSRNPTIIVIEANPVDCFTMRHGPQALTRLQSQSQNSRAFDYTEVVEVPAEMLAIEMLSGHQTVNQVSVLDDLGHIGTVAQQCSVAVSLMIVSWLLGFQQPFWCHIAGNAVRKSSSLEHYNPSSVKQDCPTVLKLTHRAREYEALTS
jgi:hypothetical protein